MTLVLLHVIESQRKMLLLVQRQGWGIELVDGLSSFVPLRPSIPMSKHGAGELDTPPCRPRAPPPGARAPASPPSAVRASKSVLN